MSRLGQLTLLVLVACSDDWTQLDDWRALDGGPARWNLGDEIEVVPGTGDIVSTLELIAPTTNASRPPGEWQTYDITFVMPSPEDPGTITVVHNGVTIIDAGRFSTTTGGAIDDRIGVAGSLRLQDHGHAVRYRNIRVRPL